MTGGLTAPLPELITVICPVCGGDDGCEACAGTGEVEVCGGCLSVPTVINGVDACGCTVAALPLVLGRAA